MAQLDNLLVIARHLSMQFAALISHHDKAEDFIEDGHLEPFGEDDQKTILSVVQSMIDEVKQDRLYGVPSEIFMSRIKLKE
ncbi:hypothetical protein [Vibrio phage BONAISHI]|nr:hypothetical protein [Vibrio phage BONAISHI]